MGEWTFPPKELFELDLQLGAAQYANFFEKSRPPRSGPVSIFDRSIELRHRDQRPCNSCVAHAIVSMLEGFAALQGVPDVTHDPAWLHRCIAGKCCKSVFAIKDMMTLLFEAQLPIGDPAPGGGSCSLSSGVTMVEVSCIRGLNAFREALDMGLAVVTPLWVDETFVDYSGDIYSLNGSDRGHHAAVIVGYNDVDQTWICRNSFGASWGEEGNFRAAYYTLGIAGNAPGFCCYLTSSGLEPWKPALAGPIS